MDSFIYRNTQTLYIDFGQTFGGSHHIRRVNRLVRRDHDKFVYIIFYRHVCHITGSLDVGVHSFARVFFHQGNMFIGCRMKNILRMESFKNTFHSSQHPDISHNRSENNFRISIFQLQTKSMHRCLGTIKQDQLL